MPCLERSKASNTDRVSYQDFVTPVEDEQIAYKLLPEEVTLGILSHVQYASPQDQEKIVLLPFYGEENNNQLSLDKVLRPW